MIYLIHYNRKSRETVSFIEFDEKDRKKAQASRLSLELQHNLKDASQEIILLEASSAEILQQTHSKYFQDRVQHAVQ